MVFGKILLSWCFLVATSWAVLPDRLTVDVGDVTGDGAEDTIVLVKRSLRGSGYRVMAYDKATDSYKQVPTPEVRTYRGYVETDRSMLVNAVIEPGNKLHAFFSDGRNLNAKIEDLEITVKGEQGAADPGSRNQPAPYKASRQSPTQGGYVVPKYTMRKISVGVDIAHDYYVGVGEDLEKAVARVESRINDSDFFYARDMGIAWEIQECVVRVGGDPRNWKTWWTEQTPAYINSRMKFKWPGGGGSSGRLFTSGTADHQHTCTLGSSAAYSRSLGHEVAHGLGAGHASSWEDTMGGSRSCLGVGTVQRMIDHSHVASKDAAPAIVYGAPLPPYAMEDGANTMQDTPLEINLLENDYDGNGDQIALGRIDETTRKGGAVEKLSGGIVRYTPPEGFLGMDEFTYEVADEGGLTNRHGYAKIYVRNNGLATHILFDETSGGIAHDVGPYQAHGSLKNGLSFESAVPGRIGGALQRDANAHAAARVECEGVGDPMRGDLSVSLWVKYPQTPVADGVLACKGGAVIPGRIKAPRGGWFIGHLDNGTFRFAGNLQRDLAGDVEEATEKFDRRSTEKIKSDRWYHLVMVLDRSQKIIRAWVDGVEQTASEWATHVPYGLIESSHSPLVLFDTEGQQEQGKDTPCALDDFRIYNKVLTERDVEELFSAKGEIPAGAPYPANAASDALAGTTLRWRPGKPEPAYTFDVYFGTDKFALGHVGRQDNESIAPKTKADTTYFWRIDEVTASGQIIKGDVWRFHTGGHTMFDPPLRNPGFEQGTMGKGIADWNDSVGYTFTANADVEGYPATPDGNSWAELDRSRWIYQQIGHYSENRELEIRFLHGKKADKAGHAVFVSLYAGGIPTSAGDDNVKINERNPIESVVGASLVARSGAIAPPFGSGADFKPRNVRLSTGTGHEIGAPLWLMIHTDESVGRTLFDQIEVLDVAKRR